MSTYKFKCPTCGATKEIKVDREKTPNYLPPSSVPCGWRGCMDYAIPVDAAAFHPSEAPKP